MGFTVREETDMKIPASKVPAQMWAEKAKAHYGSLSDVEREVLELWESSKQVYG
jgi:hypothetical protein